MENSENTGQFYEARVIAQLFNLSIRRIQQLFREFSRDDLHSDKELELRQQKLQAEVALKESQGELHRLKTEIAAGKYISKEEVTLDYTRFFVTFKKFAMSLPSRLAGIVSGYLDPVEVRRIEKDLTGEVQKQLEAFVVAGVTELPQKKNGKV